MTQLQGKPGELRATIHVKRKATGKTETYEIVGHAEDLPKPEPKVHDATGALVGPESKISNEG